MKICFAAICEYIGEKQSHIAKMKIYRAWYFITQKNLKWIQIMRRFSSSTTNQFLQFVITFFN